MQNIIYRVFPRTHLILLLKLREEKLGEIRHHLRLLVAAEDDSEHEVRCPKILNILGKYDLLLPLEGPSISILTRVGYNIISSLEQKFPNSVHDFTRIPAFRWKGLSSPESCHNSVAFVEIKLRKPLQSFADNKTTVLKSVAELRRRFSFRVYGGLSWHEVIIDLAGPNFHTVTDFFKALTANPLASGRIVEYSTIPAWNPDCDYQPFNFRLRQQLKATDYTKSVETLHLLPHEKSELDAHLGFIDLTSSHEVCSIAELESQLQFYQQRGAEFGVRKYSSFLTFEADIYKPQQTQTAGADSQAPLYNTVGPDRNRARRADRDLADKLDNVVKEKVEALKIQLRILRNDLRFRYLIPSHLLECLDSLDLSERFYPEADIQGYIATLQHLVLQRLAGTYPASSTGIITGYADGFGGYQRILLAAESLIGRAMRMMLPDMVEDQQILIIFDYPGIHQVDLSIYEQVRQLYAKAPIIVRLTCLKYEPWSWHRGIKDIAVWCREIDRFLKQDLRPLHHPPPPLSAAHYSCRVLRPGLYKELQIRESHPPIAVPASEDGYRLDRDRFDALATEMASVEDFSKDGYRKEREKELQSELYCGTVFANELRDAEEFRYYLNAYFSLPLPEREKPQVSTSFLMSLYNSYRVAFGG